MKYLIILILFVLTILVLSCNNTKETPYIVISISEPDNVGFSYINYVDSNGTKCFIYDDAKNYKIGDTINEN